jgi:hypothetical protein
MDEPQGGGGHSHQQTIETLIVGDLTRLQVEAVAFPITKRRFDPKPFASSSPSAAIGWLMTDNIARRVPVVSPVYDQVNGWEGIRFGQRNVVHIAALAPFHCHTTQRPPTTITAMEQGVGFDTYLPTPPLPPTIALQPDSTKLGIAQEHDTCSRWQVRLYLLKYGDLDCLSCASEGQYSPAQWNGSVFEGHSQDQDALLLPNVCAIHHQVHLPIRPVSEQVIYQRQIMGLMIHVPVVEEAHQALNQTVPLTGNG